MQRPIKITRIADPKRNQFMLSYEDGKTFGPYMHVVLKGEQHLLLTLAEGPTRGDKGIRFPGVGSLSPGESRTVTEWELGHLREHFEPISL